MRPLIGLLPELFYKIAAGPARWNRQPAADFLGATAAGNSGYFAASGYGRGARGRSPAQRAGDPPDQQNPAGGFPAARTGPTARRSQSAAGG